MEGSMASDPNEMFSILIGIPGARALELEEDDAGDVDLRLVIETNEEPSSCQSCGTSGIEVGRLVQDLGITSAGENIMRVLWSRRQFTCATESCPDSPWLEENGDVDAFVVRIAQARPIRFS